MLKNVEKPFIFVLCVLICFMCASCSSGESNSSTTSNPGSSNEYSSVDDVIESTSSTKTSNVGTRLNPVPIGENATYNGMENLFNDYKAELTVTDVIRGADAWALVKKGNKFNDKPESGKEYILVKFKIKVLESVDDKKVDMNNAQFTFVNSSGATYDDFISVSGLKPALTDLYAGAETEGYAYELIDEGDNPLVVFHEGYDGEVWFATK